MERLTSTMAAGQVLVAGYPAGDPPEELLAAAARGELGGIILFKRNVTAPDEGAAQIVEFTSRTPEDLPLLVAVDQEGGRVARLRSPVLELPPMRRLGDLDDLDLTLRAARILGRQLAALGFTMNFAPVLDVDTNPQNPVIGDRAFGRDPERVARHGIAFAGGLSQAGLLASGKHFPGHGDTDLDSHLALPRLSHPRARLDEVELAPFRAAAAHLPSIMTAHVVFDALEPGMPATLSRTVVRGLLREELGYEGVIVSDDLEMKAVSDTYGVADAAERAIDAGCDMLLVCSRVDLLDEARRALVRRAERDPLFAERLREAALRSLAMRRRAVPPRTVDTENLHAALHDPEARALESELRARLAEVKS